VYEYLGEVIGVKALHKRLKDYGQEGIKHFYFMELQKDQVRLSLPIFPHISILP
jgi:histone-lysine N-methyltransferase SETD2